MDGAYVPARGDVVWLAFDSQIGHEQMGTRLAVTVSPSLYNEKVGLGVFCPVKSLAKGYPFEVALPEALPISGVILSDQVKSLDWQARKAQFICTLPEIVIAEVLAKIRALVN